MSKLTDMQALFVAEYLKDLNATKAAIRAGYSENRASEIGYQLLQKTTVSKAIADAMARRIKRTEVTQDRVVQEYARLAFSNMRDFVDLSQGGIAIRDISNLSEDEQRCIAEVSETTTKDGGSVKFKLHDKKGALDSLARHLGMFNDKLSVAVHDPSEILNQALKRADEGTERHDGPSASVH